MVRSTLPEATAVAPAVMRTPEQGGKRKPVTGEGRAGDAEAAETWARCWATRSAAPGGEAGVEVRRWGDDTP